MMIPPPPHLLLSVASFLVVGEREKKNGKKIGQSGPTEFMSLPLPNNRADSSSSSSNNNNNENNTRPTRTKRKQMAHD